MEHLAVVATVVVVTAVADHLHLMVHLVVVTVVSAAAVVSAVVVASVEAVVSEVVARHPHTEHLASAEAVMAEVVMVAEDRPALTVLLTEEDHLDHTEHPPTEVADPRPATAHRRQTDLAMEDLAATTVPRPLEVVATATPVEVHRRPMAHRRVETEVAGHHPHTEHPALEVEAYLVATAPHLAEDHLRVTVHLAPVVAVSEVPADILTAEVVTLEATEVVATQAAVASLEVAAVGTLEAVEAVIQEATEVADTLEATEVADTLEATEVVATLVATEVVATLAEAAEVVTLEAAEAEAEAVRATLATEATNINRDKCSPRATTFDLASPAIEDHRTPQRDSSDLPSSTLRPERNKVVRKASNHRFNGTSIVEANSTEAESKVVPASSKSFPKHPGIALNV